MWILHPIRFQDRNTRNVNIASYKAVPVICGAIWSRTKNLQNCINELGEHRYIIKNNTTRIKITVGVREQYIHKSSGICYNLIYWSNLGIRCARAKWQKTEITIIMLIIAIRITTSMKLSLPFRAEKTTRTTSACLNWLSLVEYDLKANLQPCIVKQICFVWTLDN